MDLMVPHLHFPPALHRTPQLLALDWCVLLTPHPPLPVQLFSVFVFSLCHLLFLSSASLWMEIKQRGIPLVTSIQKENYSLCF